MNRFKLKVMTRSITWPLVLALAAAFTFLFSVTPANAATVCTFVPPTLTVRIDPGASATLSRSGTAIQLNGSSCGTATVTNADTIVVTGAAGAETLTLQLALGPFAPGAAAEATGAAEIELEVDLGTQPAGARDRIVLQGTGGNDVYRLGSAGGNLNGDNDADLTGPGGGVIPTIGAELVTVSALSGDDTVSGEQAVSGSGAPVPAPISLELLGGDGDDTLKGGSFDDTLDGNVGADFLKGNGGIDTSTYAKRVLHLRVDIAGALDGTDADNDGVAEEGDTTTGDVENLIGGKGPDLLIGSDAINVLTGNDGNDELRSLGAVDSLDGGAGTDKLVGGLRNDIEHGGPGNDTFDQGAGTATDGADELFGEAGTDTVDYTKRKMDLAVRLDGLANDGADFDHDHFGLEEADNVRTDIERVLAGPGDDFLVGGDLTDTLVGGSGNDLLDGGLGADLLDGATGIDTVSYEARAEHLMVTAGDSGANDGADANWDGTSDEQDNVKSTVENVRGGHGDDYLYGNASANLLEGGEGGDVLDGFAGADVIAGGPGPDYVTFFTSAYLPRTTSLWVTLDDVANDGTDLTLNGTSEEGDNVRSDVETVDGGSAPDVLVGNSADNSLYGEGGDDQLDGQGGADNLFGFDGDDTLIGRNGTDFLEGDDGNDTFLEDSAPNGADEIWGGPGALDSVHYTGRSMPVGIWLLGDLANDGDLATNEGDNIHSDVEDAVGGSADDTFEGSNSVNHFYGGPGNDNLHGYNGSDLLFGGANDDTLYGDAGDDALSGGPDNDNEQGGPGRDVMLQQAGANGADTFSDSDFDATVDYSSRTTAIVVHMDGSVNDGQDVNGDWIAEEGDNVDPSISVVDSGSGRDLLTGRTVHLPAAPDGPVLNGNIGDDHLAGGNGASGPNSFGTFLNGGAGNDWLEGSAWSDRLSGGSGDDVERGNDSDDTFFEGSEPNGADVMYGNGSCCGPGGTRDVVDYGSRMAPVSVSINTVADDGDSATGEGDNVSLEVEVIRGGFGNDVLSATIVLGNVIYGQGGDDVINGGSGPDILYGDFDTPTTSDGNDVVSGGDADDLVYGQGGADSLLGGRGDDIITGGPHNDGMDGGEGSDIFHALDATVDTVDGGPDSDGGDFDPNDVLVNIP